MSKAATPLRSSVLLDPRAVLVVDQEVIVDGSEYEPPVASTKLDPFVLY